MLLSASNTEKGRHIYAFVYGVTRLISIKLSGAFLLYPGRVLAMALGVNNNRTLTEANHEIS